MKTKDLFITIILSMIAAFLPLSCYAWSDNIDTLISSGEKVYTHPFMLADSSRLERLSKAGSTEPWKTMKSEGIRNASAITIDRSRSDSAVINTMYSVINYNTLGFILDPANKTIYKNRILDAISYFDKDNPDTVYGIIYTSDGDNWTGSIPPGNTFASAVIALDIIYPSLSQSEITDAEKALGCVADAFWANSEVHYANTWGVRGIWAAYNQDYETLKQCYDEWLYQYNDSVNSDGGQLSSSEYAYLRYAASQRNAKILLPYIMEYMELDDTFFSDEKNINAAEFLLGYTHAPNGEYWIFGDTTPGNKIAPAQCLLAYVAPRHSQRAAGYGAFLLDGGYGAGSMLKLLLGNDAFTFAEPKAPESRIFNRTGAFFYDDFASKSSVAGVMYNQDRTAKVNGHSHTETNSIGMYAYGKMVMANSGYAGFAKGSDGYTWKYVQTSAASGNTVLINYDPVDIKNPSDINDHNNQWNYREPDTYGKGIVNGFTTDSLCYAKGDSGAALPNGTHLRSFVMVGGTDSAPGYFVEFDQIKTQNSGDVATVIQRPVSDVFQTVTDNTEYTWSFANTSNSLKLSAFLVQSPDSVEFKDAIVAHTSDSIEIKSMFAKYTADETKDIRVSTVLFPHDSTHSKPSMRREKITGASGARLMHSGGIADYIFSSKGGLCTHTVASETGLEPLMFEAKNVILRKHSGNTPMYFAEDAMSLSCAGEGFEADNPVNILKDNMKFTVEAFSDVKITFNYHGIQKVYVNGETADDAVIAESYAELKLGKGISKVDIITADAVFKEHFEAAKSFDGWASANGGVAVASCDVDGTNGVYRLESGYTSASTGSADSVLQFTETLDGVSELKFKVKTENCGKSFRVLCKSQSGEWLNILEQSGEDFKVGGVSVEVITNDTLWHDYSVQIDTNHKTLRLIRDACVIYNGSFSESFNFKNTMIRFQANTGTMGEHVSILLDDICLIRHSSNDEFNGILYETDFDGISNELTANGRFGWASRGNSSNSCMLRTESFNGSDAVHSVASRPQGSSANADATMNIPEGSFFEGEWLIEADITPVSTASKLNIAFREAEKVSDYFYSFVTWNGSSLKVCSENVNGFTFNPGQTYKFKIVADLYDFTASVYIDGVLYADRMPFASEPADASKLALRIQNITSSSGDEGEYYIDNLSIRYKDKPRIVLNGNSVIRIPRGFEYSEPGAEVIYANHNSDDVSLNISGYVDTSKCGLYVLTYSAQCGASKADSVTRKIIVENNTANRSSFVIREDFENTVLKSRGALSGTWTNVYGNSANYAFAGTVDFGGNRVIRAYTRRNSSGTNTEATLAANALKLTSDYTVDMDICPQTDAGTVNIILKDNTDNILVIPVSIKNGEFYSFGKETGKKANINEWYGITVEVKPSDGKMYAYLDGSSLGSYTFSGGYSTENISFRIQNWDDKANKTGTLDLYADNISIAMRSARIISPEVVFDTSSGLVKKAYVTIPGFHTDATVFLAVYEGNNLKCADMEKIASDDYNDHTAELECEAVSGIDTRASVIITDGTDTMRPLYERYDTN